MKVYFCTDIRNLTLIFNVNLICPPAYYVKKEYEQNYEIMPWEEVTNVCLCPEMYKFPASNLAYIELEVDDRFLYGCDHVADCYYYPDILYPNLRTTKIYLDNETSLTYLKESNIFMLTRFIKEDRIRFVNTKELELLDIPESQDLIEIYHTQYKFNYIAKIRKFNSLRGLNMMLHILNSNHGSDKYRANLDAIKPLLLNISKERFDIKAYNKVYNIILTFLVTNYLPHNEYIDRFKFEDLMNTLSAHFLLFDAKDKILKDFAYIEKLLHSKDYISAEQIEQIQNKTLRSLFNVYSSYCDDDCDIEIYEDTSLENTERLLESALRGFHVIEMSDLCMLGGEKLDDILNMEEEIANCLDCTVGKK